MRELAVWVCDAFGFSSSVQFALLTAFVCLWIPCAAQELVVEAIVLVSTQDALGCARQSNQAFWFQTGAVPLAFRVSFAFGKALSVLALLVAASTVPCAERITEASVLDEEAAAFVAWNVQEHDVLAHIGVGKALRHCLFGASCTANSAVVIPHAFVVKLAFRFLCPAVLALSLASCVCSVEIANSWITPVADVAKCVASRVNVEVELHCALNVDADKRWIVAALRVADSTSGDVCPQRFVRHVFVHACAVVSWSSVAGEAVITDTNPGLEDCEAASNCE